MDRTSAGRRYLLEVFAPGLTAADVAAAEKRAAAAAERLAAEGSSVRFLHATYVPEDETCLYLFEGPSADAVGEAGALASLGGGRIVEALDPSASGEKEGRHEP